MPIEYSQLDKITPNGITILDAVERLKGKDPWADFFKIAKIQQLK